MKKVGFKNLSLLNKKGFTLVELIVVIAIVGILAGVLIPNLVGYIGKAEKASAEQEASPYISAYQSWLVEKDRLGYNIDVNAFRKTTDVAVDNNKKYYTNSDGVFLEVIGPSASSLSSYYEKTQSRKNFVEYCTDELKITTTGTITLNGSSVSSTGFTYTSPDNKYDVTYSSNSGSLVCTKK